MITETESIPNLRSQNIEFTGYRLKPGTKYYSSFSRTDMSDNRSLTVPKLIEVTPVKGAFQVGETVIGRLLTNQNSNIIPEIRFRVATPNHKEGPYNAPTLIYEASPYDSAGISSSYSATSTIINVDTGSLNEKSDERFFGHIVKDMRLVGQTSNAEAQVKDVRLISDKFGALQGSLHIPDGNPNFSNTSADPTLPLALRFPCFAIFTFAAAVTRPAVVDTFIILFPSPPVPQQSTRLTFSFKSTFKDAALIAKTAPVNSSDVSPFFERPRRKFSIS